MNRATQAKAKAIKAKLRMIEQAIGLSFEQTCWRYRADAAEFARRRPDFALAYAWLMNKRLREVTVIGDASWKGGFAKKLERARGVVNEEELKVVRGAHAKGMNAAKAIYAAALARGYKPVKIGRRGARYAYLQE